MRGSTPKLYREARALLAEAREAMGGNPVGDRPLAGALLDQVRDIRDVVRFRRQRGAL